MAIDTRGSWGSRRGWGIYLPFDVARGSALLVGRVALVGGARGNVRRVAAIDTSKRNSPA